MTVTLESTDKIVELGITDGHTGEVHYVPARVWEGTTAHGIACHAYITRIAVEKTDDAAEFERDLQEHRRPSVDIAAIPLRLIL